MRTSRRLAKGLVQGIKTGAFVSVNLVSGALHFVADVMDEGVEALEAIGDHIETKIEEMDEDAEV